MKGTIDGFLEDIIGFFRKLGRTFLLIAFSPVKFMKLLIQSGHRYVLIKPFLFYLIASLVFTTFRMNVTKFIESEEFNPQLLFQRFYTDLIETSVFQNLIFTTIPVLVMVAGFRLLAIVLRLERKERVFFYEFTLYFSAAYMIFELFFSIVRQFVFGIMVTRGWYDYNTTNDNSYYVLDFFQITFILFCLYSIGRLFLPDLKLVIKLGVGAILILTPMYLTAKIVKLERALFTDNTNGQIVKAVECSRGSTIYYNPGPEKDYLNVSFRICLLTELDRNLILSDIIILKRKDGSKIGRPPMHLRENSDTTIKFIQLEPRKLKRVTYQGSIYSRDFDKFFDFGKNNDCILELSMPNRLSPIEVPFTFFMYGR